MTTNLSFKSAFAVRVGEADMDHRGHVNNSVYLRWIEAATHNHWTSLADDGALAAYDWLAIRHEIDYRLPAYARDELEIVVRVVDVRRARAWYEAVVRRSNKILVEARSCWGCIDVATKRLTVIPPATAARFLQTEGAVTSQ